MPTPSTTIRLGLAVAGSLIAVWNVAPAAAQISPASNDIWNGFSFGIGGVGAYFRSPTDVSVTDQGTTYQNGHSLDGFGGYATIEAGKDWHMGRSVFGVYGDLFFGSQSSDRQGSNGTAAGFSTLDMGNGGSVVARAGRLINENFLVYGLLGLTAQQYRSSLTATTSYSPDPLLLEKSGTVAGVSAGFGSEVKLTDAMTLKGEYRFTYFDAIAQSGTSPALTASQEQRPESNALRLVLSVKLQ